jgi:cell fate (sporulation/competence/biofilm development) regulator YlbF (YheA/YmcA/DUF963 family)
MNDSPEKIYEEMSRRLKLVKTSIELNGQVMSLIRRKEELEKLIQENQRIDTDG